MKNNDVRVHLKANSNIYMMKPPEWYAFLHEKKVYNISECNLLHDILKPSKHNKI